MQRFYIPSFEKKDVLILDNKDIFHQLIKVLRIRVGEQIIFFDGVKNIDFVFEIVEINKKNLELKFIEEIEKETELSFELNLFQAMPNKMEKIEYILQKGVEIGYRKFVFYRSERSQKMVISEKKFSRLYKIMIEAVEQSGRSFVPSFQFEAEDFKGKFLSNFEGDEYMKVGENALFLHTVERDSVSIKKYINGICDGIEKQDIYIGPEGGFSETEIEYFEKNNFSGIYLGNRILRTETAGVVVGFTLGQMI